MSKLEIIKIAENIDIYNISIKPFNDCCSIYVLKINQGLLIRPLVFRGGRGSKI